MINAAIQDEVEAVQGAGNQGRGKDIATIVNAEKEEAQVGGNNYKQIYKVGIRDTYYQIQYAIFIYFTG